MKRTKHNLSSYQLLTCDMGQLVPIGLTEVLPRDTMQHVTSALIRLSPMAAPVMHPIRVRVHHFFVPHRLSWGDECGKKWEDFITGGENGNNSDVIPTVTTTADKKNLLDYLGVPPKAGIPVSALPVRAFNLIFNEFYKDQDLVTARQQDDLSVPNVAWEKDYLTTSRPWTQKGPEITLPLGGTARVQVQGDTGTAVGLHSTAAGGFRDLEPVAANVQVKATGAGHGLGEMVADLSTATAANVNDVRRAFALQRFAEARARYGSRYTEYLRYLGAYPSDQRLRRPEFLGGGSQRVAISEVLQTANEATQARYGVGDLYGHGVAGLRANAYRKTFQEHGYVISVMSVRPKAMYKDAIHRTWLRRDREDFWQKELEFIGQQAVMNHEIFAQEDAAGRQTFSYSDRYREYRESPSLVSGEFRDTLNYWHLAREFQSPPSLNESFIKCVPSKRIFNEQTTNSLWVMVQHRRVARRLVARSAYGKII